MEPLLDPTMTKIRLRHGAVTNLDMEVPHPRPLLTVGGIHYNDADTVHVVITTANLSTMPSEMKKLIAIGDPSGSSREAFLFRNVIGSDSHLSNYVAIDFPTIARGDSFYTHSQLRHIALKTYTAFLGCKMMGWTKVVTGRVGVDAEIVDALLILSAWLAGIEGIHFTTQEGETSRAFEYLEDSETPDAYEWYSYAHIMKDIDLVRKLYPVRVREVDWRISPPEVDDIVRFDARDRMHVNSYIYAVVTHVSHEGVVEFEKLDTKEVKINNVKSYVSPIIPSDSEKPELDVGILVPVNDGKYNYNKNQVRVFVVTPSDSVLSVDHRAWYYVDSD